MYCIKQRLPRSLVVVALDFIVTFAILLLATVGYAQSPPGHFLTSPFGTIVECNTDGSNCFNVVRSGGDPNPAGATDPSIASNGTIAFAAINGLDGTCAPGGQGLCRPHVFVMNADGNDTRQVTFNPADPSTFGGDLYPAISPDGTMVAFISNRTPHFDGNGNPHFDVFNIYVVKPDGTGLRQVSPIQIDLNGNAVGTMSSLAWSPDSKTLAFNGNRVSAICGLYFGNPVPVQVIGTINVDGTGETHYVCLNGIPHGSSAIDWSPNGKVIAYGRSTDMGDTAIAFIGSGSGLTFDQLGGACIAAHCIHFSPDSSQLAYLKGGISGSISVINLDGSGRIDTPVDYGNGMWWAPGTISSAGQLNLAPNPVEVWPGYSQQLIPTLLDTSGQLIIHTAASYTTNVDPGATGCIRVSPYGLASYGATGNGSGSITATNAGLISNSVAFKCWATQPCTYNLTPGSKDFDAAGGSQSVAVAASPGSSGSSCPWRAASNVSWITISSGSSGSGNGTLSFTVAPNTGPMRDGTLTIAGTTFSVHQDQPTSTSQPDLTITKTHSQPFAQGQLGATYTLIVSNTGAGPTNAPVTVTDSLPLSMTATSFAGSGWSCTLSPLACQNVGTLPGGERYTPLTLIVNVSTDAPSSVTNTATVSGGGDSSPGNNTANDLTSIIVAQRFIPVTPCRIMDTRDGSGFSGAFGPPFISGNTTRTVPVSSSSCGIPAAAKAYSLNATVVPHGTLGYLTLWPTGADQPLVSTLNAIDGQITANAAIVPAGGGSINAFVTDATDLILDINGYFLDSASSSSALVFYPVTPCRVVDTRNPAGILGGPILNGNSTRSLPIPSSSCGIPTSAQAYAFNATVVPTGFLNYLTLWPAGALQPVVSTLNAPDGQITANMAIVPAGASGAINAFVTENTHLVLDITGYFAPPGTGGLSLFPVTPCRVLDTRNLIGPLGGPILSGDTSRSIPVAASPCNVPASAQAFSMNATVVPSEPLGFITVWPTGVDKPLVSTLNALDGQITANALIVPAGTGGTVSVFTTNTTQVIFDISGYFAP
jgi:uncharacterized repeat protein (TIGR01451 family)